MQIYIYMLVSNACKCCTNNITPLNYVNWINWMVSKIPYTKQGKNEIRMKHDDVRHARRRNHPRGVHCCWYLPHMVADSTVWKLPLNIVGRIEEEHWEGKIRWRGAEMPCREAASPQIYKEDAVYRASIWRRVGSDTTKEPTTIVWAI